MKHCEIFLFSTLFSLTFLYSCQKDDINSSQNKNAIIAKKEFVITSFDGKEVQYLQPSLLIAVRRNLLESNRTEDAKQLFEKYDTTTGVLKGSLVEVPKFNKFSSVDTSSIANNSDTIPFRNSSLKTVAIWELSAVTGEGHIQSRGWQGFRYQSDYIGGAESDGTSPTYIGTTGKSLRLEAFKLKINPTLLTNPNIIPTIYYQAYNGYGQWTYPGTWASMAGTTGQSLALYRIKIWFGSGYSNFHVYYTTHNRSSGWYAGWNYDGQEAGTSGRLEAFAFYILKY